MVGDDEGESRTREGKRQGGLTFWTIPRTKPNTSFMISGAQEWAILRPPHLAVWGVIQREEEGKWGGGAEGGRIRRTCGGGDRDGPVDEEEQEA